MADKNINSDKDNAYIETLLNKLRETLGQNTPAQGAGDFSNAQETDSAAQKTDHVADNPVKGQEQEENSASTEAETVMERAASVQQPTSGQEASVEPVSSETAGTASFPYTEKEDDVTDAHSPDSEPAQEQSPLMTVSSEKTKEEPAPEKSETSGISSVPEDEERNIVKEPARETLDEQPAAPETDYARTVLPRSSRISEEARHPVSGRYRDFDFSDESAKEKSVDRAATDILTIQKPIKPEKEQLFDETPAEIPADAMPIPDPEPALDAVTVCPEPVETAESFSAGKDTLRETETDTETLCRETRLRAPASVWDTLFPNEKKQDTPPEEEPAPSYHSNFHEETEEQCEESAPLKKRKTFADCDFDSHGKLDGKVTDKILTEPVESLGGDHSKEQIAAWKQELGRRVLTTRIKCIVAGVFAFLLLLFELFPRLTDKALYAMLLTRVPGAALLIDLQLLLLVCLICYRPIYRGFAALRFGRMIPETFASVSAVLCIGIDVALYISRATQTMLSGLVGATVVLSAALADYFRVDALRYSFRAYTSDGHHYAALLSEAGNHRLLGRLYSGEEDDRKLMEAENASQIDGFVEACRTRSENRTAVMITLAMALLFSVFDFILLMGMKRGAEYALWSAVTVFCGTLPLSCFATHRFLFRSLCARVAKERVGVAGEDAVYAYAGTEVVTFDDSEAFPAGAVQVNGIKLCGDFRLDKALYLMASLFDRVGGPLNGVFRVSTSEVTLSDDVTLRAIHENGIEAQVNHEDVCVGTKEFLERLGVEVFRDSEDEHAEEEKNHVLYVAYRAQLCAKFYVHYEISASFESNVEYYAKHGVSSVILTADPLLNEALLDQVSYISEYDVRVVRKDVEAVVENKNIPRTSPLITYGPRKTLRRMPFFFKSYAKMQKLAVGLSIALAALSGVVMLTVMAALHVQTSLVAFLCQLCALLPTAAIGICVGQLNPNK